MGKEINLLENYPKAKRDTNKRASNKTIEDQNLARKFGFDFFDGDRKNGYGGYNYHPRFWENVIPTFQNHWQLSKSFSLLDVGCGKGFMLYDFKRLIPDITICGIDISEYAIKNCKEEVKKDLQIGNAKNLEFEDSSFDYVISITTVHNLDYKECLNSLREIERVKKINSFIVVDAYRNDYEKKIMFDWNLTAKTILHVDEWREMFDKANFTGDYFWFLP